MRRIAVVVTTVGLLSGCVGGDGGDLASGRSAGAPATDRASAAAPAGPAALRLAATPVTVPAGLNAAPFDVPRRLNVPAGWKVAVWARVPGARFLANLPNGDVLVSRPGAGRVVRLHPSGTGTTANDFVTGLSQPHDIVLHTTGGRTWIYLAESNRVVRYPYVAGDTTARPGQVVVDRLPDASSPELGGRYAHALKNIAIGPNGILYVSIGSSCNACASDRTADPVRGSIYAHDARGWRIVARGIRNAEGLAFTPEDGQLWAVVNNRDNIAYPNHRDVDGDGADDYGRVVPGYVDDHPPEEFIRVRQNADFGWPFCNPNPDTAGRYVDMPFDRDVETNPDGGRLNCATATRVEQGIPAHSAPLGLTILTSTAAPAAVRTGAAVALHGSWNRTRRTGYKVVWFPWLATHRPGGQQDLVTGWVDATSQAIWGRPVDVAARPDGSLLVSDDHSGTVYRLTDR